MSTHGKSRLACRLIRLRDAMTGTRSTGHIAHCADCQAYYHAGDSIVDQLRTAAPGQIPAPDDLAQRIARAVRQSTPAPRRSRASRVIPLFLAGAAAAFIFAFYLFQKSTPKPASPGTELIATASSIDLGTIVTQIDSLRMRLLDSVEPAAETIAAQNPLTQEISSVQADARTALDFIALNFLPSDSARQIRLRADTTRS